VEIGFSMPRGNRHEEALLFERDALLLVGHGSTVLPDAARPLAAHADVIRSMRRFAEVEVGMLRGQPNAPAVFEKLSAPIVHVVPFFFEDGYFARIAIPDLLLLLQTGSRVVRFCRPVGMHDGIATLMKARLLRHHEVAPETLCVLLVGHGSSKTPGRAECLRRHAQTLSGTGLFGSVRMAWLEEAPFVADALAAARDHVVAVMGYFANEGVHATSDLPRLIAAERTVRGTHFPPVHDLGTIAADDMMPRLIIDMVVEKS